MQNLVKNKPFQMLIFFVFALSIVVLFDALSVYRVIVFKAVPHDDYAPYLQFIASLGTAGEIPASPWRERIGSVILSYPFLLMPALDFSGDMLIEPALRPFYLAMSVANSFFFYTGWILIFLVCMHESRPQDSRLSMENIIFIFLALLVSRQILSLQAMDGIGLFLVAVSLALIQKKMFNLLMVYAIFMFIFNEKVSVVILGFFLAHSFFDRSTVKNLSIVLIALFTFLAYRIVYGGDGGANQTSFEILDKVTIFLTALATPRGILLNLIPLIFTILCTFFVSNIVFRVASFTIIFLLLAASIQAEVYFNVGRIVFYGVPLYVFAALLNNE